MNVYVDSSVLLRVVLEEEGRLRSWKRIESPISSQLIRLECLRTIDRARIRLNLPDEETAKRRAAVLEQLDGFTLVPLERPVFERAEQPFPTRLGSLDAIHLASAIVARSQRSDLFFATHDDELALAARAMGFTLLEN
jgi:predicted nucleic acid-binding protein